jgi:hypothetical protein
LGTCIPKLTLSWPYTKESTESSEIQGKQPQSSIPSSSQSHVDEESDREEVLTQKPVHKGVEKSIAPIPIPQRCMVCADEHSAGEINCKWCGVTIHKKCAKKFDDYFVCSLDCTSKPESQIAKEDIPPPSPGTQRTGDDEDDAEPELS